MDVCSWECVHSCTKKKETVPNYQLWTVTVDPKGQLNGGVCSNTEKKNLQSKLLEGEHRGGTMARRVKTLITQSDHPSSVPGTHTVKGENQFLEVVY